MVHRALSLILALSAGNAFGHGEDRPGPHGGEIRMPGPYHTELVKKSEQSYLVYLLDLEFKNPVVKESKVDLVFKDGAKEVFIPCVPKADAFECRLDKGITPGRELRIRSQRLNIRGAVDSIYQSRKLPHH